jgi:hypothetical protein
VVSAAAGAFLYHMYAKISMLEQMVEGNGAHISLGSLLDMAKTDEEDGDPEAKMTFGFNPRSRNIRRKNV